MTRINPIHTSCKNCVFAIYNDITQGGCHLGYIDRFRAKNIDIVEAYDNDKEFYIVNEKKCIGYREDKWFKNADGIELSIEDKIKKFKESNVLKYAIIINLRPYSMETLESACDQISKLSVKPQKIAFIRYKDQNPIFPFDAIKNLLSKYNIDSPWRIQTMLDVEEPYRIILHNFVTINRQRFIVSVAEPSKDLANIINTANDIVHNDMDQFSVLSNDNHSTIVFSSSVYRFAAVNKHDILSDPTTFQII